MFSGGSGGPQATSSAREEQAMKTLALPAKGYSEHILYPVGYHADIRGHGYWIWCVYRDRPPGRFGDTQNPCSDGDIMYVYVQNLLDETNTIQYNIVRSF